MKKRDLLLLPLLPLSMLGIVEVASRVMPAAPEPTCILERTPIQHVEHVAPAPVPLREAPPVEVAPLPPTAAVAA